MSSEEEQQEEIALFMHLEEVFTPKPGVEKKIREAWEFLFKKIDNGEKLFFPPTPEKDN